MPQNQFPVPVTLHEWKMTLVFPSLLNTVFPSNIGWFSSNIYFEKIVMLKKLFLVFEHLLKHHICQFFT